MRWIWTTCMVAHDLGLFNLDDESIKPFYHSDLEKIDPPPFWITPNPW
jgi:hypothetical protein